MGVEVDSPRYEIVGPLTRFDERDHVMARDRLVPDSTLWKAYFSLHPELEERCRKLKELPGLRGAGNPLDLVMLDALRHGVVKTLSGEDDVCPKPFEGGSLRSVDQWLGVSDQTDAGKREEMDLARASVKLKGLAELLGADLIRIGPLNQAWIYSHTGARSDPKRVGMPITLTHRTAISLAVAMDPAMLATGPGPATGIGAFKSYTKLALISVALVHYITRLGYPARAHNQGNYLLACPPVAIDAGMGELGRNGIMITEQYGNCVKLAVVTTDMPLKLDKPVNIGVEETCSGCTICAEVCPAGAISFNNEKKVVRGVKKWKLNDEACYRFALTAGHICGLCVAACPMGKPKTWRFQVKQPPPWLEPSAMEWQSLRMSRTSVRQS